jgi:hypothetical protein
MRTALTFAFLFGLGSLLASAQENETIDHELPLVKDGVLGTINVLRELDAKTGKNRVTVEGNADFSREWAGGPIECTIDGSGMSYLPAKHSEPWVAIYKLPGVRTVSSLVIAYDGHNYTVPDTVRLEGSGDGGKTWFEMLKTRPRDQSMFVKCFKPAKVTGLRMTQRGGNPRTREVFVYADPGVPVPLFGSKDSGAFSFLRDLWYRGRIKSTKSLSKGAWAGHGGGIPHVPFMSTFCGYHSAMCYGEGQQGGGTRLYLRLDLDKAYPMNYGLISGDGDFMIAAESRAEVYTANGDLDPAELEGNGISALAGQGWVLQKAWEKDPGVCKGFLLAKPGKYNQILVVWDLHRTIQNNRWSHLEMFGVETPGVDGSETPSDNASKPATPEERGTHK